MMKIGMILRSEWWGVEARGCGWLMGDRSTALFDQMKKHFGIHCHLLRLRSGGRTVVTDDDAVVFPTVNWRSAAEELADITSKQASPPH